MGDCLLNPADLKVHLSNAHSTEEDENLINYLTAGVWDYWCRLTGREWAYSAAYTEFFSVPWKEQYHLYLREAPVEAITSIHDDPLNWAYGDDSLIDPGDYTFDPEQAVVILKYSLYIGERNVKVVYKAGYKEADFPEAYKQVLLMQAARWFLREKRFEGFEQMDEHIPEFLRLVEACRRRRV